MAGVMGEGPLEAREPMAWGRLSYSPGSQHRGLSWSCHLVYMCWLHSLTNLKSADGRREQSSKTTSKAEWETWSDV